MRRASTTKATRPVALGAATALVSWTPAKEEVAAIIVACVCAGMNARGTPSGAEQAYSRVEWADLIGPESSGKSRSFV